MDGKIALEEHVGATEPDIVEQSREHFLAEDWPAHRSMLLDVHDRRLAAMDDAGIEKAVLSLLAPGIQSLHDRGQAVDWARRLNDHLAEQVARRTDRFAGFAALPLQDPDAATVELRRAVGELGMVGALVNGFSQVDDPDNAVYLDDRRYDGFWAAVADLDVPLYLHPRDPLPSSAAIYDGHPWLLGSTWAFGVETGTHMLRLMGSGLFDRHPGLQVVLGHLGELLPFAVWRADHRIAHDPRGLAVEHTFSHYLTHNVHVTTSGDFRTPALMDTITEIGADRVLFSVDYPFENMIDGPRWFDAVELGEVDKRKIASENARRLLRLP